MINKFGRILLDIESTSLSDEDKFVINNKHVEELYFFQGILNHMNRLRT